MTGRMVPRVSLKSINTRLHVSTALNVGIFAVRQQWGEQRSVFLEGRKVWCNPRIKAYGYEHPIPEVPTSDYNLGIILTLPSEKTQLLRTAGVPADEILITTNDEILGIRIQQREADYDVEEDVNKILPRAHIRHVRQAQIAQKTVKIEVRKEVEAFRANEAITTEENLNEMLDSNEARRSAHSQSQAWLLEEVDLQFVYSTNVNSREEVICLLSMNMTSGKKYSEAYKFGTQLNDEMGRTFCCLSGWFKSLEVEEYEPFAWEDSKRKRKADGCPE
ncbi:hypothetical protein BY996DRAFT_8437974 [Phakopsora pachyrhizi]|nr:hypothetical protein BY996DRAFT_8437974 [Phakopsora pachyrhizi]